MGTGYAQSSFLNCFSLHLGHGDPFLICQRQLPIAFLMSTYHHYPCHCYKHTNPHFYNCSWSSAVIPLWPGASRWVAATQVARGSAASKFAGSHYHFSPRLCLITRTFLKLFFPNCLDSCSNFSISLIPSSFLLHPFGKRHDHVGQVVLVFQGQSWHNQLEEGTMIWQIKGTEDYN